jgi:hypothetical protein
MSREMEGVNTLRRVRVQCQQLDEPMFSAPRDLVSWMGAIQAHDYGMSKWAVGARLRAGNLAGVEAALLRGDILRTHVMRPTWHLVAAGDIRWMLQLSRKHIVSASASRDKALEITESLFSTCNDLIARALEGGQHLTRQEIGAHLSRAGIAISTARLIHFMLRAEVDGIVCSGADRGNKPTYALLDERVPPTRPLVREEALVALATKYFRSHSPASEQDFAWWSGLTLTDVRGAIHLLGQELRADRFRGERLFVHHSCGESSRLDDISHFLPAFDEYLISYKERSSILETKHHVTAISSNGTFRPIILHAGNIVGTWQKIVRCGHPTPLPSFFDAVPDHLLSPAAHRYESFYTDHALSPAHE